MNEAYRVDSIFSVKMKHVFPSMKEKNGRHEWKCHASIVLT